jgi:hypothetical protein
MHEQQKAIPTTGRCFPQPSASLTTQTSASADSLYHARPIEELDLIPNLII